VSGGADARLEASLRHAGRLVAAADLAAIALADLPGFDPISLPPTRGGTMDQAQLRAIAVLYLASELEGAGVILAADDLARIARTGSLSVDLGAAAPLADAFWRSRHERATAEERLGLFASLFGGPGGLASTPAAGGARPAIGFEDRLIDLCEALYKLDEQATNQQWGGVAQQARVRHAAEQLLDLLARAASGLTAFLAAELLGAVRDALALLNHPAIRVAFGARSVRDVIAGLERRLRRAPAGDFDLHVRRGQSGMTILAWLGDAAPLLSASRPLLGVDHPVIAAAVDWLETSLTLTETDAQRSAPRAAAPRQAEEAEGWAALAR
jgi:hypothetical protein